MKIRTQGATTQKSVVVLHKDNKDSLFFGDEANAAELRVITFEVPLGIITKYGTPIAEKTGKEKMDFLTPKATSAKAKVAEVKVLF